MKQTSLIKITLAIVCTLGLTAATPVFAQTTIASWAFESNTPSALPGNYTGSGTSVQGTTPPGGPFASDISTYGNGNMTGSHASPISNWYKNAGNGSFQAINSDHWAIGDYYQFNFTATANLGSYQGPLTVSWDQTRSASGPSNWLFEYSINGGAYTQFGPGYTISNATWNVTTYQSANFQSYNMDGLFDAALNAGQTISFEIIENNVGGSTGGTGRVDNFTIAITTVPEPATLALAGLGGLSLMLFRRQRR